MDKQARSADPLRPADYVDGSSGAAGPDAAVGGVASPALGFVGWMRWGWRQLTSMRTALILLLLLAIAAIPGSLVPQRSADPNGVVEYYSNYPELAPFLDSISMFDVYASPWFSAIYILLFISLIGCVLPRTKHHWQALRSQPPRTPARLARLADFRERDWELSGDSAAVGTAASSAGTAAGAAQASGAAADGAAVSSGTAHAEDAAAAASRAIDLAQKQLRSSGYRVARYDSRGAYSVSAERGYLRETGNLVFHAGLVGVLVAVGVGGGLAYTGQRVVIEGTSFTNTLLDYSSFNPGRFVDTDNLPLYSLTLDEFTVDYEVENDNAIGMATGFVAHVSTQHPGEEPKSEVVQVNKPLTIDGNKIYLLGNGYAPTITIRDAAGEVVFHDDVAFLPQDDNMTSLGIVKVPDGLPVQIGLVGFFYPTVAELESGALTSSFPALVSPRLTLDVYEGDLGIDDGVPRSVYALDTSDMTKLTGRTTGVDSIQLDPGQTVDLPNGLGTITFENAKPMGENYLKSVKRFASLQVHHDDSAGWVLVFALLSLAGLLTALFVPRRRMWVKATPDASGTRVHLEYAALARGDDPTLAAAVESLERSHGASLGIAPAPAEAGAGPGSTAEPGSAAEPAVAG